MTFMPHPAESTPYRAFMNEAHRAFVAKIDEIMEGLRIARRANHDPGDEDRS